MSLGGPTLWAGKDLFDQAVDAFLENDIVVVDSAGNAGPSSITIGSPGTAYGALTVGAASLAHNVRIVVTLQNRSFPLSVGSLFLPSSGPQTADFSSRGPNADGRGDPDVTASGQASFGMGFTGTNFLNFASGTSFSSPSVAGVAAVLREAFPDATARQIRNAIIMGANPNFLADNPTESDHGAGYADAEAARVLLGTFVPGDDDDDGGGGLVPLVPDTLEPPPFSTRWVSLNLSINSGLQVKHGDVTESFTNLEPGERGEAYFIFTNTALSDPFDYMFHVRLDMLYNRSWDHTVLSNQSLFGFVDLSDRTISANRSAIDGAFTGETYERNPSVDEVERLDSRTKNGFIRLVLTGPRYNSPIYVDNLPFEAFGHQLFP